MDEHIAMIPECPICKGTGWIWSMKTPGLRKRCYNCEGTGQKEDD